MGVNSPVESLDMFRQSGLGISPRLAIGVGNRRFLSSAQDAYPHVQRIAGQGGKSGDPVELVDEINFFATAYPVVSYAIYNYAGFYSCLYTQKRTCG